MSSDDNASEERSETSAIKTPGLSWVQPGTLAVFSKEPSPLLDENDENADDQLDNRDDDD